MRVKSKDGKRTITLDANELKVLKRARDYCAELCLLAGTRVDDPAYDAAAGIEHVIELGQPKEKESAEVEA